MANLVNVESLIRQHQDSVYRQMVRVCGNHDDAEDALAEAILSALRASSQLSDPANFRAWLATIGTRACARSRIKSHLSSETSLELLQASGIEFPDPSHLESQKPGGEDLKQCVARAVEALPPLLRHVYVSRELEQEPAEAVARRLQISIPALKSRLSRARALVRSHLNASFECGDFLNPIESS